MTALPYRELYCPAHFGNSYEVMGDAEADQILAEAAGWGFNVYSDWFDTADLKFPGRNPRREYLLPLGRCRCTGQGSVRYGVN